MKVIGHVFVYFVYWFCISTILIFDFVIVPTVWYFFVFFYIILVLHILVLIVFFYIQCLHRLWNFDRYLFRNLPNYILYIKQILWNKQLKEWFHNCPLVALFILTTLNCFWVLSLWWSWRIRNYIFLFKFGLRLSDFNVYTNLWSRRWWSRTNLQKVISFLIW